MGAVRWLPAIVGLFLLAHLAQAHCVQTHSAHTVAPAHVQTVATRSLHRTPALVGGCPAMVSARATITRCAVTQILAPRTDALPDCVPVSGAFLSPAVVDCAAAATGAPLAWPPRPAGPTRQALLQRFTL